MPISRVLSFIPKYKVSAIYLILLSPTGSSGLPLGIGRAILRAPIYMTLQPIRRTASSVAKRPGELLPHLFTLTTPKHGGYFLLRYSNLAACFPLRSIVLCVARTFLTSAKADERQTGKLHGCKDTLVLEINLSFGMKKSFSLAFIVFFIVLELKTTCILYF